MNRTTHIDHRYETTDEDTTMSDEVIPRVYNPMGGKQLPDAIDTAIRHACVNGQCLFVWSGIEVIVLEDDNPDKVRGALREASRAKDLWREKMERARDTWENTTSWAKEKSFLYGLAIGAFIGVVVSAVIHNLPI